MSNLTTIFEQRKQEFIDILPSHIKSNASVEMNRVLALIKRDAKLSECTPASVFQCLKTSLSLGLMPNSIRGLAYLIPYSNKGTLECQFQIGYRGMLELVRRSGVVSRVEAHVAYSNDKFECKLGTESKLIHEPTFGERGSFVCVYAIAFYKDGSYQFEIMTKQEIDKIKSSSQSMQGSRAQYSPWNNHYDEMAKKTVLKRLCKYVPMSEEMERAWEAEEDQERQLVDAETGEVIEQPKTEKKTKKQQLQEKIAGKIGAMEIPTDSQKPSTTLSESKLVDPIDVSSSDLFAGIDL